MENKSKYKRTPLKIAVMMIKQRTTNPNHNSYKNYGARGIRLCEEWSKDYSAFEKYCLENGWYDGCQIDRINNDGNYEPGNIRFVSLSTNQQNKRNNRFNKEQVIEIRKMRSMGKTMQIIADEFGTNSGTISRICSGQIWKGLPDVEEPEEGFPKFNNMSHKFTYEQVMEILKSHYDHGTPKKRLAREYNAAPNTIRYILSGRFWKEAHAEFFSNRNAVTA